ncbi:MAG: GFA family protein, partial [Notoacmeibacter sp.]
MSDIQRGKCLCESVKFSTRGPLRGVVYCHCTQCRRQTGHFLGATNVPNEQLEVTGKEHVKWFKSSDEAERGFCQNCGSVMFWKIEGRGYTSVTAGLFENPTQLQGSMHIFVADKGDYYEINDGLPQYDRSSPSV